MPFPKRNIEIIYLFDGYCSVIYYAISILVFPVDNCPSYIVRVHVYREHPVLHKIVHFPLEGVRLIQSYIDIVHVKPVCYREQVVILRIFGLPENPCILSPNNIWDFKSYPCFPVWLENNDVFGQIDPELSVRLV